MPTYTTLEALEAYLNGDPDGDLPTEDSGELEPLIDRAEKWIDAIIGGAPVEQPGAANATPTWRYRRLDPSLLTPPQREALSRATCACVQFELAAGLEVVSATGDFVSGDLAVLARPATTPPRVLAELSGWNLLAHSGCVKTPPDEAA